MSRRVTFSFLFGAIAGCCISYAVAYKVHPDILFKKSAISDSENAIINNDVCYYQSVKKNDITYDILNSQSTSKMVRSTGKFLRVDIGSLQDIDVQKKVMTGIYNDLKNLTNEKSTDSDIWVTSDIHGDVKMLMKGLILSGLVEWNGELKQTQFKAYGKELPLIYPKVTVNPFFNGVYVNLGDIIDGGAFGMASLYVLHDIYEQAQRIEGMNDKIKIIIGNHEYYDMRDSNSPYMNSLLTFADMFGVFYEKDGLFFSHSPLSYSLKKNAQAEKQELKAMITDDKDDKVNHLVWGVLSLVKIPKDVRKIPHNEVKPHYVSPHSVYGHVHGNGNDTTHYVYDIRKDVLNVSTDRFNSDNTKIALIYRIDTKEKKVYSYTATNSSISLMKNQLNKNLWSNSLLNSKETNNIENQ